MKLKSNVDMVMYQQNISAKSLSEQSGVGHNVLSRVKNHNQNATLITAFKLSKALNTPIEKLFEVVE